jgi:hypothetical protein
MDMRMTEWDIHLEVDTVLRAQGGDPDSLRARNHRFSAFAEQAISEGIPLISPSVHQLRRKVIGVGRQILLLEHGAEISASLVAQHMATADEVVAALLTIGPALETHAARVVKRHPALGLALDAVGSAAIEALSHAVCSSVDALARDKAQHTTVPLSPGMVGWPLDPGQAQLFALWNGEPLNITLTDSSMMVPSKSLSMLIGVGANVHYDGKPCDYCSDGDTCRYRRHND